MLAALIKKEIVATVLDLRFVIASLLFLVLISLGMYVSRKDYEQRLANYRQEHQMYRQKYGKEVSSNVEVHGFRPPSMPSVFATGLDHYIPDKVMTSRSGIFRTTKGVRASNSPSLLFGRMDLLFNMCFVASWLRWPSRSTASPAKNRRARWDSCFLIPYHAATFS